MYQQLLHRAEPRSATIGRLATVVFILVFAAWLALFGVAAPWDASSGVGVAEFAGRFFGLLVLLAAIFSPLAIAAIGGGRPHRT